MVRHLTENYPGLTLEELVSSSVYGDGRSDIEFDKRYYAQDFDSFGRVLAIPNIVGSGTVIVTNRCGGDLYYVVQGYDEIIHTQARDTRELLIFEDGEVVESQSLKAGSIVTSVSRTGKLSINEVDSPFVFETNLSGDQYISIQTVGGSSGDAVTLFYNLIGDGAEATSYERLSLSASIEDGFTVASQAGETNVLRPITFRCGEGILKVDTVGASVSALGFVDSLSYFRASTDVRNWYLTGRTLGTTNEGSPTGLFFSSDGTKLYYTGTASDVIRQYTLTTPWAITTRAGTQDAQLALNQTATEGDPHNFFFRPDGLRLYVVGIARDRIRQYNLSTAWQLSSATYAGESAALSSAPYSEGEPRGIWFNDDGTRCYVVGSAADRVMQISLSDPWNVLTGLTLETTFSVSSQEATPHSVIFNKAGTRMYVTGTSGDDINEYRLSTPWDISTASFFTTSFTITQEATPTAVFYNEDIGRAWVVGTTADLIREMGTDANVKYYGDSFIMDCQMFVGGRLEIASSAYFNSSVVALGAVSFGSTLGVTGATTLSSTLGVTGATTLSSTLSVSNTTTISGVINLNNTIQGSGNFSHNGGAGTVTHNLCNAATTSGNRKTINIGNGAASGASVTLNLATSASNTSSTATLVNVGSAISNGLITFNNQILALRDAEINNFSYIHGSWQPFSNYEYQNPHYTLPVEPQDTNPPVFLEEHVYADGSSWEIMNEVTGGEYAMTIRGAGTPYQRIFPDSTDYYNGALYLHSRPIGFADSLLTVSSIQDSPGFCYLVLLANYKISYGLYGGLLESGLVFRVGGGQPSTLFKVNQTVWNPIGTTVGASIGAGTIRVGLHLIKSRLHFLVLLNNTLAAAIDISSHIQVDINDTYRWGIGFGSPVGSPVQTPASGNWEVSSLSLQRLVVNDVGLHVGKQIRGNGLISHEMVASYAGIEAHGINRVYEPELVEEFEDSFEGLEANTPLEDYNPDAPYRWYKLGLSSLYVDSASSSIKRNSTFGTSYYYLDLPLEAEETVDIELDMGTYSYSNSEFGFFDADFNYTPALRELGNVAVAYVGMDFLRHIATTDTSNQVYVIRVGPVIRRKNPVAALGQEYEILHVRKISIWQGEEYIGGYSLYIDDSVLEGDITNPLHQKTVSDYRARGRIRFAVYLYSGSLNFEIKNLKVRKYIDPALVKVFGGIATRDLNAWGRVKAKNALIENNLIVDADAEIGRVLIGDNVMWLNLDTVLTRAEHAGKYMRLTKTGTAQALSFGSDFQGGEELFFFRATDQVITITGTVNGISRLADVSQDSGFGLKCIVGGPSPTFDLI